MAGCSWYPADDMSTIYTYEIYVCFGAFWCFSVGFGVYWCVLVCFRVFLVCFGMFWCVLVRFCVFWCVLFLYEQMSDAVPVFRAK